MTFLVGARRRATMHDMSTLEQTAPAFVEVAHRIVWATVATVDGRGRPRSRILHPVWEWDGGTLTGWIATGPTRVKVENLAASPFASCTYWDAAHDTVTAECHAELLDDDDTRREVWQRFVDAPEPVRYDPSIVPGWDSPTSPSFAALRLTPWRLRVFPGSVLMGQGGEVLDWSAPDA
jgi:general stress protein 26